MESLGFRDGGKADGDSGGEADGDVWVMVMFPDWASICMVTFTKIGTPGGSQQNWLYLSYLKKQQ